MRRRAPRWRSREHAKRTATERLQRTRSCSAPKSASDTSAKPNARQRVARGRSQLDPGTQPRAKPGPGPHGRPTATLVRVDRREQRSNDAARTRIRVAAQRRPPLARPGNEALRRASNGSARDGDARAQAPITSLKYARTRPGDIPTSTNPMPGRPAAARSICERHPIQLGLGAAKQLSGNVGANGN